MPAPIITLTTDFGLRDPFVGIMKGVILGIAPDVQLVDLTHDVAPQDVLEAALALESAVPFFPPGTIHLAVVDPGVGSPRRAMALRSLGHYFVGPDNGLFTFALRDAGWHAVSLDAPAFRLPAVSRTFHGRDVFAPAAAHLATGAPIDRFGAPIADPVRLAWPESRWEAGEILGEVIAVDRFGNLLTNVTAEQLDALGWPVAASVRVADVALGPAVSSYTEGPAGAAAPIIGSTGRLEIFVRNGRASALLGVERGAPVRVSRA